MALLSYICLCNLSPVPRMGPGIQMIMFSEGSGNLALGHCWRLGGGKKADGGAREVEYIWVTKAYSVAKEPKSLGAGCL